LNNKTIDSNEQYKKKINNNNQEINCLSNYSSYFYDQNNYNNYSNYEIFKVKDNQQIKDEHYQKNIIDRNFYNYPSKIISFLKITYLIKFFNMSIFKLKINLIIL
jgi:DNA replication protein DnaD